MTRFPRQYLQYSDTLLQRLNGTLPHIDSCDLKAHRVLSVAVQLCLADHSVPNMLLASLHCQSSEMASAWLKRLSLPVPQRRLPLATGPDSQILVSVA